MHTLLHLPLLGLALILSSNIVMSMPQDMDLTIPVNATQFNATADDRFVCNKRGDSRSWQPQFADCAGALLSLPFNPSTGVFYNSGRGDFQLPYFKNYRTCQVLVELRSTFDKVTSSWLAVHMAATELNGVCQIQRQQPGLANGYVYLDDLKSLKITLQAAPK